MFVKAPFRGCVSGRQVFHCNDIDTLVFAGKWQVLSPPRLLSKFALLPWTFSPNVCAAFLTAPYKLLIWLPLFFVLQQHIMAAASTYSVDWSRNEFPLNFAANDVVQSNTQPYKYAKHKWNGMLWNLLQQWNLCSTHHTRWVDGISNCNKLHTEISVKDGNGITHCTNCVCQL